MEWELPCLAADEYVVERTKGKSSGEHIWIARVASALLRSHCSSYAE